MYFEQTIVEKPVPMKGFDPQAQVKTLRIVLHPVYPTRANRGEKPCVQRSTKV
jgi:hypothetical protein